MSLTLDWNFGQRALKLYWEGVDDKISIGTRERQNTTLMQTTLYTQKFIYPRVMWICVWQLDIHKRSNLKGKGALWKNRDSYSRQKCKSCWGWSCIGQSCCLREKRKVNFLRRDLAWTMLANLFILVLGVCVCIFAWAAAMLPGLCQSCFIGKLDASKHKQWGALSWAGKGQHPTREGGVSVLQAIQRASELGEGDIGEPSRLVFLSLCWIANRVDGDSFPSN